MEYSVFQGRSFLAEKDFTKAELVYLIDFAAHLKALKKQGIPHPYLAGKNIALLFEKTSTRTRSAFTVAANDLGAHPEFLGAGDIQLGKKESVKDTAKVLGSMFDGIEYRGFSQSAVETLAQYSTVPVWNGLTDQWHPTQMLADFLTIKEHFGALEGLTLAYVGDGRNNVANSLLVTGAILGVNVHVVTPESLFPEEWVINLAKDYGKDSGSEILITSDIPQGVKGADILYTDVWVSMGEEAETKARVELLLPYQVNQQMVQATENDNVIFLHCLPAFHDQETLFAKKIAEEFGITEMEVSDEVFQAEYAKQFQQAENRMHSIKAVMAATLGNLFIPRV
ncbi:ornithine carbamoyltransferase [Enterococcus asini]|uniref:ornithine carbamoyltransferase n=1 Tax=Enterococcus asini TaxID=57732 RepID=UPI00288DAB2A|nr:ornithine carbamoyltransferase [Enterococcus asini]MDT2756785.1 ornithine carbamoyltransferase [Enterococcus asini]